MPVEVTKRDYSLIGKDSQLAEELGLASAEWYACPIPRKRLKELMQRKDGPAMDNLIECPKHNGRFDFTTGKAKGAPVCVDLKTHPTKVEGSAVFIQIT